MDLFDSQYGIWRSVIDHHEYSDLKMDRIISMGIFLPRPGRAQKDDGISSLQPTDDLPPATMITHLLPAGSGGRVKVRGSSCDDYEIRRVVVNGREAHPTRPNYAEWEVELDVVEGETREIIAHAEDAAGNVEKTPHTIHRGPSADKLAGRVGE